MLPIVFYYTPNRWLVLTITLVVTCRIAYGVWRSWGVRRRLRRARLGRV